MPQDGFVWPLPKQLGFSDEILGASPRGVPLLYVTRVLHGIPFYAVCQSFVKIRFLVDYSYISCLDLPPVKSSHDDQRAYFQALELLCK